MDRTISPNGQLFATKISVLKIHVWQNTPTGYVPWSTFTSRLPIDTFLWSPTSDSVLCQCTDELLLLHPDNHSDPLSPDENGTKHHPSDYLVVHPTNHPYILVVQPPNGIITVLDDISGTIQWVINTGMEIQDIKMIDNIIYVVDVHKLVSWYLEPGGVVQGVHETLAISAVKDYLKLSNNCTQIAFARQLGEVALYDIKTQKTIKSSNWDGRWIGGMKFSPDGHQLWCMDFGGVVMKLEITEEWNSGGVTSEGKQDDLFWDNPFSPDGYHVGIDTMWAMNSGGSRVLWLPPHWRGRIRWEGNYLSLVNSLLPVPIIIKFKP